MIMKEPDNIDVHWFRQRDGTWSARIEHGNGHRHYIRTGETFFFKALEQMRLAPRILATGDQPTIEIERLIENAGTPRHTKND